MTERELSQYRSLVKEVEELSLKIDGCISHDVVKGSDASFPYICHGFNVQGIEPPDSEYVNQLKNEKRKLLKQMNDIREWVSDIPDSELRRIFRYRYIEGDTPCSWKRVAKRMGVLGDGSTERRKHNKYLNQLKK